MTSRPRSASGRWTRLPKAPAARSRDPARPRSAVCSGVLQYGPGAVLRRRAKGTTLSVGLTVAVVQEEADPDRTAGGAEPRL